MPRRIEGVSTKLLDCAKKEFLEKGYRDASLRMIARNAGTTPKPIYIRFADKAGLFSELVLPAAEGLKRIMRTGNEAFASLPEQTKESRVFDFSTEEGFLSVIGFIYDNFDEFKLIICCSEGTIFANYIEELTEIDIRYIIDFINVINNNAFESKRVSMSLLHILSRSFYTGIFEPVLHNMSREEAELCVRQLRNFFMCGWVDMFNSISK